MGWKLWLVVLPKVSDEGVVASSLAGVPLRPWHERTLRAVLSKEDFAVARLRDSTLVVSKQAADIAFEDDASTFVARLEETGSDSAWAFRLHSASNAYGWACFNGRGRVRCVFGSVDGRSERGEPVSLEQDILSQLGYFPRDNRSYIDAAGRVRSHDQLGEDIVMALLAAIVGIRPDDDEFLEAKATILAPAAARIRGPVRGDELLNETAKLLGWQTKVAKGRWEAQLRTMKEQLQGGRARLPGILDLMPRRRDAREGHDPRTGERITIPASVSFAANVSTEWKKRDLDQAPEPPRGASEEARFVEGIAAAIHGYFYQGAPSVELPSLGHLVVERVEEKRAQNPRTGAILTLPASNRWTFAPDIAFSAGLK